MKGHGCVTARPLASWMAISPALTAHNLRHGTATLMFENGVDELTTQHILGHSRIEITREIYTDLRSQQKMKSLSKLNRGMSKMMSVSKIKRK